MLHQYVNNCVDYQININYLGQVCAFCTPHWSSAHAHNNCSRNNCVELWIKLGGDVYSITTHADNQCPFDGKCFNYVAWHEHT